MDSVYVYVRRTSQVRRTLSPVIFHRMDNEKTGIGNPCSFSVRGYESPDDRSGVYNTIRVNPRVPWAKKIAVLIFLLMTIQSQSRFNHKH